MERRRIAAVVVSAGRGERAGVTAEGPKQFRTIGGRAVLARTLEAFATHPGLGDIILVTHPDDLDRVQGCLGALLGRVRVVSGGSSRQASVLKGLEALEASQPEVVLIHDGVRPFVSQEVIDAVVGEVTAKTGAIPAMPVTDTIKRMDDAGRIAETVQRQGLFGAQTPQGFPFRPILEAHRRAAAQSALAFTDDASLFEWLGHPVVLVRGDADNVKLTLAADILAADRKLKGQAMIDVRTGNGYDVHQLVEGDHVTLCGVRIAHDQTLLGHSDADVGLHALTDALLATCGAGDIGTHFPPSDPQWKGAESGIFVRKAVEIVRAKGGRVCNVDITLIAEAPKVGPHRTAMVQRIADMTGLDAERISVKATTNETIGFIGRREGIAAIATASVVYSDTTVSA